MKQWGDFYIYIPEIEDDRISGKIMNPYIGKITAFRDLGAMAIAIDRMMKELDKYEQMYGSEGMQTIYTIKDFDGIKRPESFYLVQIYYTQNNSWQGLIRGTGGVKFLFKSALDVITIIDEQINIKRLKHARKQR